MSFLKSLSIKILQPLLYTKAISHATTQYTTILETSNGGACDDSQKRLQTVTNYYSLASLGYPLNQFPLQLI